MDNIKFNKPGAYKNVNTSSSNKLIIQDKITWYTYLRSFF